MTQRGGGGGGGGDCQSYLFQTPPPSLSLSVSLVVASLTRLLSVLFRLQRSGLG